MLPRVTETKEYIPSTRQNRRNHIFWTVEKLFGEKNVFLGGSSRFGYNCIYSDFDIFCYSQPYYHHENIRLIVSFGFKPKHSDKRYPGLLYEYGNEIDLVLINDSKMFVNLMDEHRMIEKMISKPEFSLLKEVFRQSRYVRGVTKYRALKSILDARDNSI